MICAPVKINLPLPSKLDQRSEYLKVWLSAQGLSPEIHHYREGARRLKTVVRLLNSEGREQYRVVKHFSLGELRGYRWLGTVLHAAHSLVLSGEQSHR